MDDNERCDKPTEFDITQRVPSWVLEHEESRRMAQEEYMAAVLSACPACLLEVFIPLAEQAANYVSPHGDESYEEARAFQVVCLGAPAALDAQPTGPSVWS